MPTRRATVRTLLNRVGGPNSISWPGFVILLAVSGVVATASAANTPSNFNVASVIGSVSAAVGAYGFLALMRVTALRKTSIRPRPWLTIALFATAALVGLVCAIVITGIAMTALGGSPSTANPPASVIVLSLLGTVIGTVMTLALGAVVVDAWREYRRRDTELRELHREIEHLRTTALADIDEQDADVRRQVEQILLAEVTHLDAGDAGDSARRLRAAALEVLRPMSHELAFGTSDIQLAPPADVRLNPRQIVFDATENGLVRPWLLASIVTVPVLFFTVISWGLPWGVVLPAVTFLVLAIGGYIVNALFVRISAPWGAAARIVSLFTALALLTAVVWGTWAAITVSQETSTGLGILLWLVPVVGTVLPIISALAAVLNRREQQLDDLNSQLVWQSARVREHAYVIKTARARALHGPVQSAALAGALRLEKAAREGHIDDALVHDVRQQLLEALTGLSEPQSLATDVPRMMIRLHSMWDGVCRITVDLPADVTEALERDRVCAGAAVDVITEGCSNAIRHGSATAITVEIAIDVPGQLAISVHDNGSTNENLGEVGLGSAVLDTICLSWSRTRHEGTTQLRVALPLSHATNPV